MGIEIRRTGRVGAEILGVDLSQNIDDGTFAAIRSAFVEHGVIFFRDQTLSEQDHIDFAQRWGPININRFFGAHPTYPEIALVVKEPWQQDNIGGGWHTDHSYDQIPALGSILVARELPPEGGNTAFASMYLAHEALPASLKRRIAGLRAIHSARHVFGSKPVEQVEASDTRKGRIGNAAAADLLTDAEHPIELTHPLSGRKAIYVNPGFTTGIVGLDEGEARELLHELYAHSLNPAFAEDFVWKPGSIAFWDNRATWHFARNDYHGQRREMHRITLEGEPLE